MAEPTGAAAPSVGDKPTSGQGKQLSAQLRSWLASLIERQYHAFVPPPGLA
jgi:hypothetical protein